MTKYNPHFWEVNVDPEVLESMLAGPDLLEQFLDDAYDETLQNEKDQLRAQALTQIQTLIQTKLTDKQRQVVELYFYQDKTQREIAQILGINQQVVSKHLFGVLRDGQKVGGAIRKLQKLCQKLDIDPQKWV
ncbi:MAG: sigma-70 family RNA polymerase sigma factor [Chloroflexota bacterium]